jgi:hypothetical protein
VRIQEMRRRAGIEKLHRGSPGVRPERFGSSRIAKRQIVRITQRCFAGLTVQISELQLIGARSPEPIGQVKYAAA